MEIITTPPRFQPKLLSTKKMIKINNGAQFNWCVMPSQSVSQFSLPKLFRKISNSLSFCIMSNKLFVNF